MKNLLLSFLFLTLFSCSKDDVAPANQRACYKDFYFNTVKGFYCLTESEVKNYAEMKRKGQTSLNLAKATEADYKAAPDLVSGCNSCR